MSYKYEMHCHTGCVSRCGKVEPERIVELYKQHGYDGIVVTDHYSPMTFKPNWSPETQIDFYLEGYRRMNKAAGDDFTVLLGVELRHYGSANDYLIYGVTEDFLYNAGNLMKYSLRKTKQICTDNGLMIYLAHPFRPFRTRCSYKYIDGVEVYNGKTSMEDNVKALRWAAKYGRRMIGGSDFHKEEHVAKCAIETEEPIKNNEDLIKLLKKRRFEIVNPR